MTEKIYKTYFQELAEMIPEDVCKRALCKYDAEKKRFILSAWGDEYAIYPHDFKIDRITSNFPEPHDYFFLFILFYLLKSKNIEIQDEWISEKDVPSGVAFFRGPHEIPGRLISGRFGNDISAFRKRCKQLQGIQLDMADAAYSFKMAPRIPAAVLYWTGDDDFPAEARLLFDKTIAEHLAPDIIFALAVEICTRIGSPKDLYTVLK